MGVVWSFLSGVPGAFNCCSIMSVALFVSSSPGGDVIGRAPDGSWPKFRVTFIICWAISEFCGVEEGNPGGGPGVLAGDAFLGVRRRISSMCWESWYKGGYRVKPSSPLYKLHKSRMPRVFRKQPLLFCRCYSLGGAL